MCFDGTAPSTAGPFDEACVGNGRYVTILLPGTGRILNLAEVEVYTGGDLWPFICPTLPLLLLYCDRTGQIVLSISVLTCLLVEA